MKSVNNAAARIIARPELLTGEWNDGTAGEFASPWLRDNLPEDRDGHNRQHLIDVADLPPEPRIGEATLEEADVRVRWQDEDRTSKFPLTWLREHRATAPSAPIARPWLEGATIDPRVHFAWKSLSIIQRSAPERLRWLQRLLQDGIAFLSEVPAVESGILGAMEWVGRAVPQPENLAYTDLGLGLHTDNPYREPVPGFQALHTLISAPEGSESLFADGFALAEHLCRTAPEAFALLVRTAVPCHYRSKSADLYAERPLIQLTCEGAVSAVHYNNRSIAPLRLPARECSAFYSANHSRHLRGCYLTRDSVYSTAALLQAQESGGEPV